MPLSPPRIRMPMLAVAAVAALAGAVGCSTGGRAGEPGPAGAAGPETSAAGAPEVILPIDAYEITSTQQSQLQLASSLVVADCMARSGFTTWSSTGAMRTNAGTALRNRILDDGEYGNRQRYGVLDAERAGRYGYAFPSSLQPPQSPQAGLPDKGKMSASELTAWRGCLDQAEQKVYGDWRTGPQPAGDIAKESMDKSLTDPSVKAAFAEWSTCVGAKGYHWDNPRVAGVEFDPGYRPNATKGDVRQQQDAPDTGPRTVSAREIAAAQADVACKQQTHVVDAWKGFEENYQKAQIEQHFQELRQQQSRTESMLRRAADIVAKPS